ncbi:hypothetical protein SADUNF_Sadunf17G0066400 [Salix dunnii]|uniref:DNA-directed RNA polymerase n=1 Tax=Salix dunnii TaxID=1413687 RepID=A0A835J685_9ROSI|nr:hypothetical protein SADUNF_Sadunf17G0066400 [Salix dunnii]
MSLRALCLYLFWEKNGNLMPAFKQSILSILILDMHIALSNTKLNSEEPQLLFPNQISYYNATQYKLRILAQKWIGWLVKNEFGIEVCENGGIKDLGHSVGVPQLNKDLKLRKERPLCGFLVDRDPYTDIVFALGVRADKEVIDLIDYASNGASIVNIFFAQIYDADEKCEHFRREDKALDFVDKMLNSRRHKARFLGYMLRCLLEAYTGHTKCDNRDSFRNKRFELASELLERELKVHGSHRDLYGDRDVHPIEHYLDASIVTNGLTRTFSTGAWCHPFKWMERVYKVVGNLGRANPLQTMIDLRKNKAASSIPAPFPLGVEYAFSLLQMVKNCGLVKKKKNLAVTGVVSINMSESLVDELFE